MAISQEARKRRLQDTLVIAGNGVIAFSAWSLAKMVLFLLVTEDERVHQMLALDPNISMTLIWIVVSVLVVLDLIIRAFVGLSARAEGHGNKKGVFYLVVAALAALVNAISAISVAIGASLTFSRFDAMVSIIIETTALTALVLVIYCAIQLRRLSKAER